MNRRPGPTEASGSDASRRAAVGIDVGGTKMLGVVVDEDGAVIAEALVPTPRHGPVGPAVASLGAGLVGAGPVTVGAGIGLPGCIDGGGALRLAANLAQAEGERVASLVADALRLPVVADNDGTCAALAEWRLGAARGCRDAVMVTVGTGIGGGVVAAGELVRGRHRFAGEPGHMVVEPGGVPCGCGRRGCWEQYASGSALARLARQEAAGGGLAAVRDLAGGDLAAIRGEHVTAAAAGGDGEALALVATFGHWLAVGIANLAAVLDPEVVVLGGGLVEAAADLLTPVRAALGDPTVSGRGWPVPPVVPAVLGPRAGAVGAAVAALLAAGVAVGDRAAPAPPAPPAGASPPGARPAGTGPTAPAVAPPVGPGSGGPGPEP